MNSRIIFARKLIGDIPDEWEYVNFKELYKSQIRDFGSFSSTKMITFLDDGIPFIKSEMIHDGNIDWTNVFYISEDVHRKLNKSHVSVGQILLSKIGSALGKAVVYEGERGVCNSNAAIAKITLDEKKADPNYYCYLLNHAVSQRQFKRVIISLLPRINLGDISSLIQPLPPIEEQTKIAQILSTWDKAIATTEKLINNCKAQKKALMQQLLTGKKRFSGFDSMWKEINLSSIANITMGSSPKSEAYNNEKRGLPLIQGSADIRNRMSAPRIYSSQITKECNIGDILLSVRAPVGVVAICRHHACIGRGMAAINAKNESSTTFIYQLLLAHEPKWIGLSQGSTFDAVNGADIKKLSVYIPIDKDEQQSIASVLAKQDEITVKLEKQLVALKEQKKSLMQQLLTGKRRVKLDRSETTEVVA